MPAALELVPLGTLTIDIDQHTRVGPTPGGIRIVGEVLHCRWEGDRVTAREHGKISHDWLLEHPDGSVSVDARLLLMTDDGAPVGITYQGRADRQPKDGGVIVTTPVFESGDPRYAWLNTVQAVARGVRTEQVLVYELFEVRPRPPDRGR